MNAKFTALMLPGLGNSGPEHWQSHWQRQDPSCERVQQSEWDTPHCQDWVAQLSRVVAQRSSCAVLVAHSSSCALVAHWAASASPLHLQRIRGALLVAPSDPNNPNYPFGPVGFGPVPLRLFPFPSIVVASADDRYVSLAQARTYAEAWGSRFVTLQSAGHINASSGFGPWPDGYALLNSLRTAETVGA
ncbi:MAG: RBBP9/YdeN family alpha/beta hydrolase [Rhodanobacteraceae bacterium]